MVLIETLREPRMFLRLSGLVSALPRELAGELGRTRGERPTRSQGTPLSSVYPAWMDAWFLEFTDFFTLQRGPFVAVGTYVSINTLPILVNREAATGI